MSMTDFWKLFIVILCLTVGILLLHYGSRVSLVIMHDVENVTTQRPCPSQVVSNTGCPYMSCRDGEKRVVEFDNNIYQFPPELRPVLPWENVSNVKPKLAQQAYFRYVETVQVECQYRSRYGVWTDGGWEICLAGPYKPQRNNCLVYSFGINNEWSFDVSVADRLGCTVRAFDPTMGLQEEVEYKTNIYFFPYGLYNMDGNLTIGSMERPVRTLKSLIEHVGDTGKIIDYLKIDIESSEWETLPEIMNTDILQTNVKQLGLETHSSLDADKLQEHITILEGLQRQGFRRWHYHLNIHVMYHIPDTESRHYSFGQEVYYININFLQHSPV